MVLPCGLQENTLAEGEASLERKQMLWIHHDAKLAWTSGWDPPSSATRRLQKHLSYVHGAVSIPCSQRGLGRDTKTLPGRGGLSPLSLAVYGAVWEHA